jgi:serine/threonine-protein kinase
VSEQLVAGRYRLVQPLGQGGIGEVWSATDVETGADVAVKLLRHLHAGNAKLAERFAREGRILARVESPHVCRVLAAGTVEDTPYLVMERIEGTALDVVIRGGRALPFVEAANIMDDVFVGLSAVHAAAIVHRDLKPPNVIIDARGRARLIDFGIAKIMSDSEAPLTSTHATLGTPFYMAPEQLDGSAGADFRADLYAAGTLAYRLLSGKLPFDSNNPMQLLVMKRHFPPPKLSERTGVPWPGSLESFLERLLALAPEGRPSDAAEALAMFREVRRALGAFSAPEDLASGEAGPASDGETPVLSRRRPFSPK